MPNYRYTITLQGHIVGDKSTLRFDLGDLVDEASALNAANQVRGSLVDITKAFVAQELLTNVISEDDTNPTDESADTFEKAKVTVYLNDTGTKVHNIAIPAPDEFIQPDGRTVDITNALLIQYVQQLAQHTFLSDNEQIDTTLSNGIKAGWVVSASKNFR